MCYLRSCLRPRGSRREARQAELNATELNDWNAKIIDEFRANQGRVGGQFDGAPLTLVHYRGRTSGREYVSPTMYLADEGDPATMYVFASKAGAPTDQDWHHNLVSTGRAQVEVGSDTYDVTVSELAGEERDRVFGGQARRYLGFAEYAEKAAGICTIPVLALRRA